MAYTIKIRAAGNDDDDSVRLIQTTKAVTHWIRSHTPGFTIADITERYTRAGAIVELRGVRLVKAKPYCGNHAGPCIVRFREVRKRSMRYLEGADWIRFHGEINAMLDALKVSADVYTIGADVYQVDGLPKGKMIVRSVAHGARKRYDYRDIAKAGDRFPHYAWNPGTEDQFTNGTSIESEEQ